MKKAIFIIIGIISVILGIIGIIVPGLPTTPFLLLSSWLFYRSSQRLHDWLHGHKWLGPYLRRFEEKQGVGWKTKLVSIILMWIMISISAFVILEGIKIRILLIILGIIGTCCVLFVVPNPRKDV